MLPFEILVEIAWNAPFTGWDFSWLNGRWITRLPSWDYCALAADALLRSSAVLDMGTGGGEFFSSLAPFPPTACATEGYAPNLPIARARLEPLGVRVVTLENDEHLPLPDASFDLLLNRHESFNALELKRILQSGGSFITQQVGGRNNIRLNQLLQENVEHPYLDWDLATAQNQLEAAGLVIREAREEFPLSEFLDIGAVVYYLKCISWQIEDFTPSKYMARLRQIDGEIRSHGRLSIPEHRFLLIAQKP